MPPFQIVTEPADDFLGSDYRLFIDALRKRAEAFAAADEMVDLVIRVYDVSIKLGNRLYLSEVSTARRPIWILLPVVTYPDSEQVISVESFRNAITTMTKFADANGKVIHFGGTDLTSASTFIAEATRLASILDLTQRMVIATKP